VHGGTSRTTHSVGEHQQATPQRSKPVFTHMLSDSHCWKCNRGGLCTEALHSFTGLRPGTSPSSLSLTNQDTHLGHTVFCTTSATQASVPLLAGKLSKQTLALKNQDTHLGHTVFCTTSATQASVPLLAGKLSKQTLALVERLVNVWSCHEHCECHTRSSASSQCPTSSGAASQTRPEPVSHKYNTLWRVRGERYCTATLKEECTLQAQRDFQSITATPT
jgi:hypothetical protein